MARPQSRQAGARSRSPQGKPGKVRLQRVMADAGIAARRVCEELIEQGAVSVNGEIVRELPAFVDPEADRIEIDGRPLPKPERHIYLMLNKPRRTVTTAADEPGAERRTVLDLVDHPARTRLFPVGRLDFDTMGLLLLTNDGDLANLLTHPRYGVAKSYLATVAGVLTDEDAQTLEEGIYLAERREGRTVGAARTARVQVQIHKRDRDRTILRIELKEGRNRQVRRMLAKVGCPVKKLERVEMGPLKLKGLARGAWRELTSTELRVLRDAVRRASRAERATTAAKASPKASPRSATAATPKALPRPASPAKPKASPRPASPAKPKASPRPASPAKPKASFRPASAAKPKARNPRARGADAKRSRPSSGRKDSR